MDERPVLVTGATGYVGGRLVPLLLERGYRVRVISRSLAKLEDRSWAGHDRVGLAEADALDEASMVEAAEGCGAAFYLIHSMNSDNADFAEADRRAAGNMVKAAEVQNLDRIIYLGGLVSETDELSEHLRSRTEVADILRSGTMPVTVLRASIILGSGSASFEILRYLVERLPVLITPRWVRTPCQPIAIGNVLTYLVECLNHPETRGETYDIGGPEIMTYEEVMRVYAEVAGLPRRLILPVPVLTPRLSSYWVHLVTPVPARLAQPLISGLKNPSVCREHRIRDVIDQDLLDARTAMKRAIERIRDGSVTSSWSDAGELPPAEWSDEGDPEWAGGDLFEDRRSVTVRTSPGELWAVITRIGGERGWYFANWLWKLRGWVDRLVGGVGLRRGRRDPVELHVGDALDFWRVVEVEPPGRLKLVAEMHLPGEAVLEFRVTREGEDLTRCDQIARFRPRGLFGLLYWYTISPFHHWIFQGMLRNIARQTDKPIVQGPDPVPLDR